MTIPEFPISYADADEMPLQALIDVAENTVIGHKQYSRWLEQYYDPAKSALIELLQDFDIIEDR